LQGQYCHRCGQNQKPPDRFLLTIINEAFDDIFGGDSKTGRTLAKLFFRPGFLTTEYFAGRRARYIQPLRLYLITSILFFFFLSLSNTLRPNTEIVITDAEQKDSSEWMLDINESLVEFNISWLSPEQNEYAKATIRSQSEKAINRYKNDPGELIGNFLELVPQVMFFLLPLFAVMLKLLYLRSGKYYSEHLILAVHNHCFLFIALLINQFLDLYVASGIAVIIQPLSAIIGFWIPIYMYMSLRTAYKQGYFLTFIKFTLSALSYFLLFLTGVILTFISSILIL